MDFKDRTLLLLEAKAAELDHNAAESTSTFFQAVYQGQASILREVAAELKEADRFDGRECHRGANSHQNERDHAREHL